MKTSREIYKIAEDLGMIEENSGVAEEGTTSAEDVFAEETCKNLVSTMNFVNSLFIYL